MSSSPLKHFGTGHEKPLKNLASVLLNPKVSLVVKSREGVRRHVRAKAVSDHSSKISSPLGHQKDFFNGFCDGTFSGAESFAYFVYSFF